MSKRKIKLNAYLIKHVFVLALSFIYVMMSIAFLSDGSSRVNARDPLGETQILEFDGTYDWDTTLDVQTPSTDYITYSDFRDNYCLAATTASQCASAANGKDIRIDTAEELYRFSLDVSLEEIYITGDPAEDVKLANDKIAVLLSLDYTLGNHIDYSVMQSKAFIPIGFAFTDVEENVYERSFTGSFDGRGFEIRSLYVAGYDYLVYVDQVDEVTTIDIALSEHYSVFNYNEGTIKNLGIVNPELEILELHTDITKLSNLVGFNMSTGIIQNVYVQDTRSALTAGMRYQVGTASEDFEAAGIVHTNQGTFTDSYYVSPLVINANYINKFDVQPVIFTNSGTIDDLVFDFETYLSQVTVGSSTFIIDTPNGLALGETTNTLKSSSSSLNEGLETWYFYPLDGYPILHGFSYDDVDDVYQIDNAIDLVFFSEVLGYSSKERGLYFYQADFVLTDDIDMSTVADDAYQIPSTTFTGSLSGYNDSGSDLGDNYTIHHLTIDQDIQRGSEYYGGLFSVLGATAEISNLNFSQSDISFTNTDEIYSYQFYIGALAGKMIGGTISQVLIDVDIDMGDEALGRTYAGSVVGMASGVIEYVASYGNIDAGNHVFDSGYSIAPKYHIGGIVGTHSTGKLTLYDVVNHGDITGMGTSSNISLATGHTEALIYTGGVIGYLNNTVVATHELVNVSNFGDITTRSFKSSVSTPAKQYIGGVFGLLTGLAPDLEVSEEYTFANLYNAGTIFHSYVADTATIKSAGIGVNKANEAVEYALLFNHGHYEFTEGSATHTQTQFNYAALIYDVSSSPVTLSRAYNYASFSFDHTVFDEISLLYYSENDVATDMRFVANYGDIDYLKNSGSTQLTLATDQYISGITTSSNVSFLNVYNFGDINVVNFNLSSYDLYIAGITTELASDEILKNSTNGGDIHFAEISGSGNIYVGGLVNTNLSGDLQDPGQSETQPQATVGIINSINAGLISSSYGLEAAGLYGIHGTSNTFIGGIATMNKGSIQNSANLGDIKAYNSNASSSFTFDSSTYVAGIVTGYNSGIVAGGVVGIVLGGDSRIYDTANNGDVIVSTNKYVRAGGVLGVALYEEADSGGITSGMGLTNDIEDSIISNGLNLGNVSALSDTIANYPTSTSTEHILLYWGSGSTSYSVREEFSTTSGNDDRPTIYSSAGGVIGYGLSVMRNMLNHGTISATDVAGGVVGATYVLGASSGSVTTVVDITTAINYGDIKAVDNDDVSSINKYELSYSDVSTYFMADGNSFIYPTNYTPEMPLGKRGFGGIFGRLQRGTNGIMTSEGGSFDFIVNANENIDLIGRLDQVQNFSSSSRYYRFNDAIYYSAKLNDTTQVVFTGFYFTYATLASRSGYNPYTYTVNAGNTYKQVGVVYESYGYNSTQFTFPSDYSYTTGSTYYIVYFDSVEVPWITEDPSDPNLTDPDTEYMYDPDFPMRTNPDLTEYIYFMPNELLADRFSTTRPDGMYVLSTTAGQSFGSVIPKNIDMSLIRMIDEHSGEQISLLSDYENISPAQREPLASVNVADQPTHTDLAFTKSTSTISSTTFDLSVFSDGDKIIVFGSTSNDGLYTVNGTPTSTSLVVDEVLTDESAGASIALVKSFIETAFFNLNQTTFNDKSVLIESDSIFVTMEEGDGSSTILSKPEIDYINNELTFSISMEAFLVSQTSVTYAVTNALTSTGALIAMRPDDYYGYAPNSAELQAYRTLLYPEKDDGIATDPDIAAVLSVDPLPSQDITSSVTISAGYFTVFSEAFIGDNLYATAAYYTNYEVFIEFLPTSGNLPGTTQIESVSFNGGGSVAASGTTDVRALGTVDPLGSITLYFEDNKGLFSQGYDFKNNFVVKYTDGTTVSPSYYSVTSTPVNIIGGIGYYDITFTFINQTVSGDYYFVYSYFPQSTQFNCYFDKGMSSANSIIDFTYYSEEDSISFNNFVITSYVNLGYVIDMDTSTTNFTENLDGGIPSYLSNLTYDIDFMTPDSLIISPFASVVSARLVTVSFTDGYKTYQMEYIIEAEDGTQAVYTHNLIERTVDLQSVLRDGNDVLLSNVFTTREALMTEFTVDLGFDTSLNLYELDPLEDSYIDISVTGTTNDGLTSYTPEEIIGLTYDTNEYLYIFMSYETLPGIYTFSFTYYRDGSPTDFVTFATDLVITKNLGTYAYLSDIKFSELANETTYPDIKLTDELGDDITTSYAPAIYFDGIDYDGSDEADHPYFQIDGRVSNVPLDSYVPFFLDYLPYGATISRYAYDQDTSSWYWTDEADASSDESVLAQLATDYTVFPDTMQEPQEGEEVKIKFRVTAEDGLTNVYYFITVTDVTYNLSIVFDIYYCTDETEGSCVLAKNSSELSNEMIILNVKNLDTDGDDTVFGVTNPADFPTFTTVNALNNNMVQFNYINSTDYRYRFGRNMAGFYTFEVELPLDQYLNDLYTYEIEFGDYLLNDASDYVSSLSGKYFYIEYATTNRTRRFNVYIRSIETPETGAPFGLFDFFKSWFE